MEQKYGEFVGVDNLYYALITADTDLAYTTGAPVYLAPVAEIAGEPEINTETLYYDNKPGFSYVTEGKTELKIVVPNIPANVMAILLGKSYDAATGRVYDNGEANAPDVAVGFRYNMGNGFRYYWFLRGKFAGGSEEAATKTDNVDVKTYELTFTAICTTYQWTINSKLCSLKRVFGDTADSAFNPTGWFTQVQTPTVTGAPTAVALSSSNPTDGATGVSKTTAKTLTFNNEIKSEAVSLIDTVTGTVVAVTKAWDAAKKVLSITPVASLAGTTKYVIAVNGVVDVYGQALAATSLDFTTMA